MDEQQYQQWQAMTEASQQLRQMDDDARFHASVNIIYPEDYPRGLGGLHNADDVNDFLNDLNDNE